MSMGLVFCCYSLTNLVLILILLKKAAEKGAPKYMEWYGAFGLLVTLIWLYLEILKLLSKLRR